MFSDGKKSNQIERLTMDGFIEINGTQSMVTMETMVHLRRFKMFSGKKHKVVQNC